MTEAKFRYSDLLPTGADDTPYCLDLVAQGAQDPAMLESSGTWLESTRWVHPLEKSPSGLYYA